MKGPRGICVLSANGAVSNVTIRQPGSSGGLLTYEVSPPSTLRPELSIPNILDEKRKTLPYVLLRLKYR